MFSYLVIGLANEMKLYVDKENVFIDAERQIYMLRYNLARTRV